MGIFPFGSPKASAYYEGMMIVRLLSILGGFVFLLSLLAHVYVRMYLRPGGKSDLDDYYCEFEDRHPQYARYTRWLQISLGGAALGMLLLFLGVIF
ncbi:MAG: hypothetical protein M1376_16290 [Planctomycetes bacterium]|nr:hypothetical protein [Planctomycetota bacterium]